MDVLFSPVACSPLATWHRSCMNKNLPRQHKKVSGKVLPYHNARVGNNNWKAGESYKPGKWSISEPSGYHVQFGIADASGEMVVKIQDPKIKSTASKNSQSDIPFPDQDTTSYDFISGECQDNSNYPNTLNGVLKKFGLD